MRISHLKMGVIAALSLMSLIGLNSCERINHNTDAKEEVATDIALVTTELASIFEFFDESADQTTGKGVPPYLKLQNFSKETKIIVLDSTYYDGDAVEFLIDFGPTNIPLKPTQRCLDGRFRGGKIKVILETHYIENTAKSHVLVEDENGFVFGTESKTTTIDKLEVDVERKLKELMEYDVKHLEVGDKSLDFDGFITVEKITGVNTPGIFGDQYVINGKGSVEVKDDEFKWNVGAPLKKKVEPGCGMIPVKGLLNLNLERLNRNITVDFDPFENESCDKIVRITNAGKMTDVVLE